MNQQNLSPQKEIGGFFEFENNRKLSEYHKNAFRFNLARTAFEFLLKQKKIKRIYMPSYMCKTVFTACKKAGTEYILYNTNSRLFPLLDMKPAKDEYVYVQNYCGQLSNEFLTEIKQRFNNVIIDNVQSFFQMPILNTDTIYSCRKYFGVPDGAYLYTDLHEFSEKYEKLEYAFSEVNYKHIAGRTDLCASDFYAASKAHEELLCGSSIMKMPLSTQIMLSNIDYNDVIQRRKNNFEYLHKKLKALNNFDIAGNGGLFFYPFRSEKGAELRKKLLENKIYTPTLWPELLDKNNPAANLSREIVYLPIDQRYEESEMEIISQLIFDFFKLC